ncbi:tRNA pseudouridine(55) synthase TruB [Alteromonas lipotrueiana]|uniref:tRNA pseudouridine(55) synthase TruB n=1 Tax=Alteromonas lipotrueiana TaxID=2803815 RepID=UPI001C45258E|nr:tRNA pseudouridine(55) synthase TruB [Alteromonas lipotrueiana]
MAKRRKGRAINGIVLLDKPVGGSSNQLLQKVRWLYQAQKAGHTGALDPLASGMLPICLGEATKFSQFLLEAEKAYEVTAKLGVRTTTSDADGDIVEEKPVAVCESDVRQACLSFLGKSKQIPSMFSALKYQGKPLYHYARQGIEVPREPRDIDILELEIKRIELPEIELRVKCSKGTYIRSLVDDIGQKLGCGAYVTRLHRTEVADYPTDQMVTIEQLEALRGADDKYPDFEGMDKLLLSMQTAVSRLPVIHIDDAQRMRFDNGQSVTDPKQPDIQENTFYQVFSSSNDEAVFLGVGEGVKTPMDQPTFRGTDKIFVSPKRRVVFSES